MPFLILSSFNPKILWKDENIFWSMDIYFYKRNSRCCKRRFMESLEGLSNNIYFGNTYS